MDGLDPRKRFICEYCGFAAAKKFNLSRHITSCHLSDHKRKVLVAKILCSICNRLLLNRDKLTSHLVDDHNQTIQTQKLEFPSLNEFESWKERVESENSCRYTRNSGVYKRLNGQSVQYLYCHRDGFYSITADNRKRSLKSQGSNKINAACPSRITCREYLSGAVEVIFVSTHFGHDENSKRLTLRKEERAEIAEKVKKGVPYDIILQSIRKNSSQDLVAANVVKQSIRNIVRDFNLKKLQGHVDDHYSVDLWQNKIISNDSNANAVLFYKRKDEPSNDHRLLTNDVMLIIVNEFQTEMLKKFGHNVICTDLIFGTNQNDLNLITILVVDESSTGIPVAFCVSNKTDVKIFSFLFEKIRDKVGILRTNVFMSDIEESPYDGWKNIMGHARYRLLNPWSIDSSWRENMTSEVTNAEKRLSMYRTLNDLLHGADTDTFDSLMTDFLRGIMNDSETRSFGMYFSAHFAYRPSFWAYSYIKSTGIETDFRLELVHKMIKSNYLYGKKDNRLAKCIEALMRYVRDASDRRYGRKVKVQRVAQKKDLSIAHQRARQTDWNKHFAYVDEVISNLWVVRSFTNPQITYTIELMQERVQPCSDSCSTMCAECIPKICSHTFSCECNDYFIRNNICKHIHALVIFLGTLKEDIVIDPSSTVQNDFKDVESIVEIECVTSTISIDDDSKTFSSNANERNLESLKIKLEQILECLKSDPDCTESETNELSQRADEMLNILQNRIEIR